MGGSSSAEDPPDQDEKHPDNKKMEHEGWDDLRDKKRSCTDPLCILLIIAVWFAMTMVGFVVTGVIDDDRLEKGNPNRLLYPMDYEGNICGIDDGVKDLPFGYYLPDRTAVCTKKCPKSYDATAFICRYELQEDVDADSTGYKGYEEMANGGCMYEFDTTPFLKRCFPDLGGGKAAQNAYDTAQGLNVTVTDKKYDGILGKGANYMTMALGDIIKLQAYIFGFGLGVSILVAFLYLYVLRIPFLLTILIWGIILTIFLLLLIGSWLLWGLANKWANDDIHSNNEVNMMRGFAYFGMALTVLYVCVMVVLRKRIQLAIGIVKQACKALASMPAIILVPVIQSVGIMIFLVPWLVYVLYLASSGKMTQQTTEIEQGDGSTTTSYTSTEFTYTNNTKYAFLYMLFCWFWTSEFVIAIGQLVVALCFTAWYFTRDKGKVGNFTVVWSFKTVLRYHLGSAAYGSLIIAIIKTIKAVVEYIKKKAKKTKNKCLEWTMCVISCCLTCLEKIMKFINKHGYILIAIYGYSFCQACRKAFFLLLRNILRVAAVNMIAGFLLFLGKIFVPTVTTFFAYVAIGYAFDDQAVSGIVAPLIFIFLLSYFISVMFSELFGMGIETILFCFIADEEMFAVENRFASGELMTTLQKTAQAAASKKVHAEEQIEKERAEKEKAMDAPVVEVQVKPAGEVLL